MIRTKTLMAVIVTFSSLLQTGVATAQTTVTQPSDGGFGEGKFQLQSSPKFTKDIKDHLKQILLSPLDTGMKSTIGWLNIQQLATEVNELEIYFNTSSELITGSGNRVGAVNLTEKKSIIFNSSLLDHLYLPQKHGTALSRVGVESLLLHEVLAALGYPDDNYEISTYLHMRSIPQDYGQEILNLIEKGVENFLKENPTRRTQNATFDRIGGTSTGVGGGGDPLSAGLKLATLAAINNNKEKLIGYLIKDEQEYLAVIALIQSVKVEPQNIGTPYNGRNSIGAFSDALKVEGTTAGNTFISVDTNLAFAVRSPQDITMVGISFLQSCLQILRLQP